MSPPSEDPRDRLARLHPSACGTRQGYMQISRARTQLKKLGVPEGEWPQYDDACRKAHAEYTGAWREAGGFGTPPGPKPQEHPCGTVERWRQHRNERRKLRSQGVAEQDLPPIDEACRVARADYEQARAAAGSAVRVRRRLRRISGPSRKDPGVHELCGTPDGIKRHRAERRTLQAQGVAEQDLPTICPKCQAEMLRQRVLRRIAKARGLNAAAS